MAESELPGEQLDLGVPARLPGGGDQELREVRGHDPVILRVQDQDGHADVPDVLLGLELSVSRLDALCYVLRAINFETKSFLNCLLLLNC